MEWIAVKNKIPENGTQVLATDGIEIWMASYDIEEKNKFPEFSWNCTDSDCGWIDDTCYSRHRPTWIATHWMPIPDKPK